MAEVARELDARRGARVRSVHEDGRLAFRLDLRGESREDLVIVLAPPLPRIHLTGGAPAPKQPTALAGALRNLLRGARVEGARAIAGERALALELSRGGESVTLWVELFGGQANLYVVDADGVVQLTPRGDVARRREASKGMPFEPVPARAVQAEPDEDMRASGSAAVIALVASRGGAQKTESAQARLRRFVKRKLKSAQKARSQLDAALAREDEADELHRRGELLSASFHLLKPGLARVTVSDFTRSPPEDVVIELDPTLPPGEQIAACYRRERKLRRAAAEAERRLAASAADVESLTTAAEALVGELASDELEALLDELPAALQDAARRELAPPAQARKRGPARAQPWHTFRSADGWRILVGRDARGNDELTLREARPGDLFLHVRGATGSHVVVPTPRGKTVPRDTLLDAAELACHFSERRAADHNEVDHTPRRYVRKPKGAAPGLVRLERSKTLSLRRDETRRARLLAARERSGHEGDAR
ncbi:MAG: NFACT RNA binding domain-containing protein [Planctomycetota bacterium]|nr:NFACT RNA binding domain-containing protein [Planctomycetota bacterium]